jgi:hypothetical protein
MKKNKQKHCSRYQLQKDMSRIISESHRVFCLKISRGVSLEKNY